jgi:dimethylglycine dehydrogenase
MGDLSVTRLAEERFWLTGSYYLQEWHQRWFRQNMPDQGVEFHNLSEERMGFSMSGPASRAILGGLTDEDVSNEAFPFLSAREMAVGSLPAVVGRISLTGELGYEIVVATENHLALLQALREAGKEHRLRLIGDRAADSLRLEKAYGIWSAEFRQDITPAMCGLDRFVAFDKVGFIGREAALREQDQGPTQRLVLLEVDAADADASKENGIWINDRLVGKVTSGAYGHHVGKSLALAYLDTDVIDGPQELTVYVVGDARTVRTLPEMPYDPAGTKLR